VDDTEEDPMTAPAASPFILINVFHTSPDRQGALVALLRQFTEEVTQAAPGFISATVHASLDGARVLNYVQWVRREDLDAVLATPEGRAHMAQAGALADRVDPAAYRVVYNATAE
jgi:quinol monooxygenase YgiN